MASAAQLAFFDSRPSAYGMLLPRLPSLYLGLQPVGWCSHIQAGLPCSGTQSRQTSQRFISLATLEPVLTNHVIMLHFAYLFIIARHCVVSIFDYY